eukprot:382516-Prymnesium_polylepis.2
MRAERRITGSIEGRSRPIEPVAGDHHCWTFEIAIRGERLHQHAARVAIGRLEVISALFAHVSGYEERAAVGREAHAPVHEELLVHLERFGMIELPPVERQTRDDTTICARKVQGTVRADHALWRAES